MKTTELNRVRPPAVLKPAPKPQPPKPVVRPFTKDDLSSGTGKALRIATEKQLGSGPFSSVPAAAESGFRLGPQGRLVPTGPAATTGQPRAAKFGFDIPGIDLPNPIDLIRDGWDSLGDLGGHLRDGVLSVGGRAIDLAGDGFELVGEVGESAVRVARNGVELVIDAAAGTIDFAGDLSSYTAEQIGEVVAYAVETGVQFAEAARNQLRDWALGELSDQLNVESGDLAALEPGEEISLSGEFDVALGASIGGEAGVTVTRNDDGSFTVSAELSADLGLGTFSEVGAGGAIEFTVDSAEEAAELTSTVLAVGASATNPVLAPIFAPGPNEIEALWDNVSAVEVSGSAAAGLEAQFGPLELGADVEGTSTYRIEFEDGHPVAAVRQTEIAVSGSAGATLPFLQGALGLDGSVEGSGSITIETRLPIDGESVVDVAGFLLNPASLITSDDAVSSIELSGDFRAAGGGSVNGGPVSVGSEVAQGVEGTITVSDIDSSELRQILSRLFTDPRNAFAGVDVDLESEVQEYRERTTGIEINVDGALFGVEGSADRSHRENVGAHEQPEVELDGPQSGGGAW